MAYKNSAARTLAGFTGIVDGRHCTHDQIPGKLGLASFCAFGSMDLVGFNA
jgi:hypothetical protein